MIDSNAKPLLVIYIRKAALIDVIMSGVVQRTHTLPGQKSIKS